MNTFSFLVEVTFDNKNNKFDLQSKSNCSKVSKQDLYCCKQNLESENHVLFF